MGDDKFANNPFRSLDARNFRAKGQGGREAEELIRRARKARRHAREDMSEEDSELFRRAMAGVETDREGWGGEEQAPAHGRQVAAGACGVAEDEGFLSLDDRGVLEGLEGLRPLSGKKKRKGRHAAAAPAKAQEAPARGAVAAAPAPSAPSQETGKPEGGEGSMAGLLDGEDEDGQAFLRSMQAMKGVRPLRSNGRDVAACVEAQTPPPPVGCSLQDFMDGKLEFALSFTDEYIEGHVVGLEQDIMNKLRRGDLSPEASCDLHGLNVMQAFETLRGFLKCSWYRGLRCVLVVPGRGKNSPDGIGILREKLKTWFPQDPFKRVVLAFCTAKQHDGGPGSVYVLLRKFKKKGKVFWDRMPADEDLF